MQIVRCKRFATRCLLSFTPPRLSCPQTRRPLLPNRQGILINVTRHAPAKPIRVLLADDHDLFRAGIRCLMQTVDGIEIIAEAGNGREALDLCKKHHPDVVLMDIIMPQLNGLDATARLASISPQTRIIILSMNANEEYILQALRCGAAGYLPKNINPSELAQAIRAVALGQTYLSPSISKHVIAAYLKGGGDMSSPFQRLTPRQREVLQLVAEGNTTKEIARKLRRSVKTVEMHRSQLMTVLGIHDIAGLVRYAIRVGLITPDV
jgi:DNA-binding NarL/FixJ family response regulator